MADNTLVGCAFTSMVAPEALLPPPWPTTKPLRFYMSNLGVLQSHRRRGIALALLNACEILGEANNLATNMRIFAVCLDKTICMYQDIVVVTRSVSSRFGGGSSRACPAGNPNSAPQSSSHVVACNCALDCWIFS